MRCGIASTTSTDDISYEGGNMGKYQYFNGVKFTLDENTGYYLNSTIMKRIHRYVWEYHHGEIPEGYHIHHKDHDKSNNDISNLELMLAKEHLSHHATDMVDKNYEKMIDNLNNNARPKAIEWHGSKKGREWHSKHAREVLSKLEDREYTCTQCGAVYKASPFGVKKFCSNKCKSKWRREQGIDDEVRKCEYCNGHFTVNKYSKKRFCSRSCSKKRYWVTHSV